MKHVPVKLLSLVLAFAVFSTSEGSGTDARSRLEAGEIVALDTSSRRSGGSARMQMLVRAPARAIWDVI
ncbi:MAG: hypothetical protein KJO33_03865, partial [Gammaproteobacteria bacterium]|nr:hypothetical protein [Gammaproteobacteria bacterium]